MLWLREEEAPRQVGPRAEVDPDLHGAYLMRHPKGFLFKDAAGRPSQQIHFGW